MHRYGLFVLTSLLAVGVNAGSLSGSTVSNASISGGGVLFSPPVQCDKVSQITTWNGSGWGCQNDNFYVPPPPPPPKPKAVGGSGKGDCGKIGNISNALCRLWRDNPNFRSRPPGSPVPPDSANPYMPGYRSPTMPGGSYRR